MKYFYIETIKEAIEHLQNYKANWLLPAFVFAANDVGTEQLVDMSENLGTDQFLDRYFNGKRLGIPPGPRGDNLLRPRLKGIHWDKGDFAGDYIVWQNTKMWGNLFSSRGYREMRLEGLIEGEKAVTKLTDAFQPRFESEIPPDFHFEYLLVWLFAFEGIPESLESWSELMQYFLNEHLGLEQFKPQYANRFKLSSEEIPWPGFLSERPSNEEFLQELAPKFLSYLEEKEAQGSDPSEEPEALEKDLSPDDPVYAGVTHAMTAGESLSFLLLGPPGTGKTQYARRLATSITKSDPDRALFLQFHPAIGYDDFVEGFRPSPSDNGAGITYELAPRLFMKFAQKAADAPDEPHVVVIDELNRGDVARVFGEVLTYLEVDYRGKSFTLPFSGNPAHIPKNLIVIATANPYDRSVTDLDDALLRRFWVIEIEPSEAALKENLQSSGVPSGIVNRTAHVFNILNDVFPHGFGHSNFLKVRSLDDLSQVWAGRVFFALKRALLHDRTTFEETRVEIERVLGGPAEVDEEYSSLTEQE